MTADTCGNTNAANCTHSDEGICYHDGTNCVKAAGAEVVTADCGTIIGKGLTPAYCKGISSDACSANTELTACIEK